MSGRSFTILALVALLAFGFVVLIGSAQVTAVSTDRASYAPGEQVTISGTAAANALVAVQVANPQGTAILLVAVDAESDGSFSLVFRLPDNSVEGTYTVTASEGGSTRTSTFSVVWPPTFKAFTFTVQDKVTPWALLYAGQENPTITVNVGDTVLITLVNDGQLGHTWTLDSNSPSPYDASTILVNPAKSETVVFVANVAGTFTYYCKIPGHRDLGMQGQIKVVSSLTVATDSPNYSQGELVTITGSTSPNTIVAINVRNPLKTAIFTPAPTSDSQGSYSSSFRLASNAIEGTYTVFASVAGASDSVTFSVALAGLPIIISKVATLDTFGNPTSTFTAGETVLIATTVQNTASSSKSLLVSIQVLDPELTVLPPTFIILTLDAGQEFTFSPSVALPQDALAGTWIAESVVFSDFPSKGGIAIGQPKEVTFTVTS